MVSKPRISTDPEGPGRCINKDCDFGDQSHSVPLTLGLDALQLPGECELPLLNWVLAPPIVQTALHRGGPRPGPLHSRAPPHHGTA